MPADNLTSEFEEALGKEIQATVKRLRKEGTTGIGFDNLLQIVKTPPVSLPGAPTGTNARHYYKIMFRAVAWLNTPEGFVFDLHEETK